MPNSKENIIPVFTEFLGKPVDYWLELECAAKMGNWDEIVVENYKLKQELKMIKESINKYTNSFFKDWNNSEENEAWKDL